MSSAANSTPANLVSLASNHALQSTKDAELQAGENASSADEDDDASDGDGDSRPRKRAKSERPVIVSCGHCKQRKVKCDRGQPRCGWCVRNGQVCEYKERKKPGLRAGYGRELEERLDKLERVLADQQNTLQQIVSYLPVAPQSNPQPQGVPQTDAAMLDQPSTVYSPALDGQFRSQSYGVGSPVNQTNYPGQSTAAISLHMPTPTINEGYAASDPPVASPSLNIASDDPESAAKSVSQDQDFPPYDLLYALTDLFFRHINTWCPILHRRSTLDALFGASTLDEADRILLHAVVATTMRFSTDSRLTAEARRRYHAASKQKVLLYGLENSSVKALQALVILALDITGHSNGPPGWNLLALITRSVVQLGLAVETTSASVAPEYPSIYTLRAMVLPEPKSFIEDESRRRLFWMVYVLDRYATIATAFEFALDDKEIDRKLPCRDDLLSRGEPIETRWFRGHESCPRSLEEMNRPENLGSFSYYIEIIGILSKIHRFLKKPVDISALSDVEQWQQEYRDLDSELNSWKFSLPSEYGNMSRVFNPHGNNKTVNCVWVMLHVTYHTAVIRLHSSAAYPTTRSPIFTPSLRASQRCLGAVEDICALCAYVRATAMLSKLGPPFAFSLWVAARLLLVHGSTVDHQVSASIHALVETLRDMGVHWEVAARYAMLLQRVLDEFAASARAPDAERHTPSTVRILADMRRCAYDLDFLISRQPLPYFGSRQLSALVDPAVRPAAPADLEYLDVFDFFNLPRLPVAPPAADQSAAANASGGAVGADSSVGAAEYQAFIDFENFDSDAGTDWLAK